VGPPAAGAAAVFFLVVPVCAPDARANATTANSNIPSLIHHLL
jgi:hypothetical protein